MKKMLVTLGIAGAMLAPTAAMANVPATSVDLSGDYGTSACYVTVDFFKIDASVQSAYPFVVVTKSGSVGGGVHCPL